MYRNYNTRTKYVEGVHVCIYCGKIVYGYKTNDYQSETYYNCNCTQALLEREMQKEIIRIERKYAGRLVYNKRAIDKTANYIRSKRVRKR